MIGKTIVAATIVAATIVAVASVKAADAPAPECTKLKDIYSSPKEMCELMWGNAFRYVPQESPEYNMSYTMWFFDDENPNDAVTALRNEANLHDGFSNTDVCHLDAMHLPKPEAQPDNFTECHPWRKNSCCSHEDQFTADKFNNLWGNEYRWDKCGKLTPECERFFVQENCFYQCDVNVGIFRKAKPHEYDPENNSEHSWKVFGMPIKADYCDSWYAACAHNYFCVESSKEFFSCPLDNVLEEDNDPAVVVAIVLGVVAAILFIGAIFIVFREKSGKPIFLKNTNVKGLDKEDEQLEQA